MDGGSLLGPIVAVLCTHGTDDDDYTKLLIHTPGYSIDFVALYYAIQLALYGPIALFIL